MGYLYRFAYIQSFLLKKREQITLLLFFSRPRLLFFFLHHRKKSKQNKQLLMIRVGRRNTTKREKKTADQNFSSASYLRPKFLECICLEKNTKVLSSRHSVHVKENERNGQDYQKYALFVPFLRLFFSPSLSLFCSHAALSSRSYSFSLSFQNAFVCVCVCARLCVSSGLIFVSEFCFHLNHKFSSRALTY